MQNSVSPKLMAHDAPPISDREFDVLRNYLRDYTGISLANIKKNLIRTRLRKRLFTVGCDTFGQYFSLLKDAGPESDEMQTFINCLTTNKTEFFRESHHFEYLKNVALPMIVESRRQSGQRVIRVWSAGCSKGHEAYSLAITLSEFFAEMPGWDIRILGSDIDSDCLSKAASGIFDESELNDMPLETKQKYFLRGTGESAGKVKVRKAVSDMVTFRNINFATKPWPIHTKFDFVFCRNVIIYFEQEFQDQLLKRFIGTLHPHGLLFLGHSESITWMPELSSLGQTIYRPSRFKDSGDNRAVKRIVAGEAHASDERIEISTLLGSCVAVCLHDPVARVGGMNHVIFADDVSEENEVQASSHAGCAQGATERLLNELISLGAKPSRMVAKLYGGAKLFDELRSSFAVGTNNVRAVTALLRAKGIPIVEKRVGGSKPVRITMQPDTGRVFEDTHCQSAATQFSVGSEH